MGSEKPFSQELYKENNDVAIIMSLSYLISTGHYYFKKNPIEQEEVFKQYDYVLFLKKNDRQVKIEVERKKTWVKSGMWQGYETLDVPERKKDSEADLLIMINNTLDTIAIMKMKDVLNSKVYKKNTIYTTEEKFYAVDLQKIKFYHFKWEVIKT